MQARKTVRIALGYYLEGNAVYNRSATYWYTQYFKSIESVFSYALENFESFTDIALKSDEELNNYGLSEDQRFRSRMQLGATMGRLNGLKKMVCLYG